jgi:hypothetical protein
LEVEQPDVISLEVREHWGEAHAHMCSSIGRRLTILATT